MLLPAHSQRVALVDARGEYRYCDLDEASARVAAGLLAGEADLNEARVAFLLPPSREFVAVLLGIWRAGGIAVPLAVSHPAAELAHVIADSQPRVVVSTNAFAHLIGPLAAEAGVPHATAESVIGSASVTLPSIDPSRRALMMYTSGTTGKPKGVVSTHGSLLAQVDALIAAWGWTSGDRALLVLPLHHVHGLVNVVCSALRAGAACEMLARFDPEAVWARLEAGEITVFTAVPTIYHRLIAAWEAQPDRQHARSAGARKARLMMSGSAALPPAMLERWREITGHTLLERYGMTEIGMALSNPLHGERRPGHVGAPLPGVEVRLVDEAGAAVGEGAPGEIEVRGPAVFLEYWRQPDATRASFRDGWFRTGDIAVRDGGSVRLLGRASVDIIKTGGFKVSALEIEDVIRAHPSVETCAVVGVADPAWGERVCAAVELSDGCELTLAELHTWSAARLAPYKIPRALKCVPSLPRNAMGKVVKPDVAAWFRA